MLQLEGFRMGGFYYNEEYNLNNTITIRVRYGDSEFYIRYDPKILAASAPALKRYHEVYKLIRDDNRSEEWDDVIMNLTKPFEDLMTQIAKPIESAWLLDNYLNPPSFTLQARADEFGQIQPHSQDASSCAAARHGECTSVESMKMSISPLLNSTMKKYSSGQIQILDQTQQQVPSRVLVDNNEYFFQPWEQYSPANRYQSLESYWKIFTDSKTEEPLLADANICQLHGLIIDSNDGCYRHETLDSKSARDAGVCSGTKLVGILVTYVENKGNLGDVTVLRDSTNENRLRWSTQIRDTVARLHEAGVVWGNAKPANVLIDMKGDAWLVDLGGRFNRGWVDEDKKDTVEGDLQGVQKIDDWLQEGFRRHMTTSHSTIADGAKRIAVADTGDTVDESAETPEGMGA